MKTITICGSVTRTPKLYWDEYAQEQTLLGNLVFMANVWGLRDWLHSQEGEKKKELLDRIHKEKILKSDEVHVLRANGYIGSFTQSEIDFAIKHGKPIVFRDYYGVAESVDSDSGRKE